MSTPYNDNRAALDTLAALAHVASDPKTLSAILHLAISALANLHDETAGQVANLAAELRELRNHNRKTP